MDETMRVEEIAQNLLEEQADRIEQLDSSTMPHVMIALLQEQAAADTWGTSNG